MELGRLDRVIISPPAPRVKIGYGEPPDNCSRYNEGNWTGSKPLPDDFIECYLLIWRCVVDVTL